MYFTYVLKTFESVIWVVHSLECHLTLLPPPRNIKDQGEENQSHETPAPLPQSEGTAEFSLIPVKCPHLSIEKTIFKSFIGHTSPQVAAV